MTEEPRCTLFVGRFLESSVETCLLVRQRAQRRQTLLVRQYIIKQLRSAEREHLFAEIRCMCSRWQQVLQRLFGFSLEGFPVEATSGRALAQEWQITPSRIFQMRDKAIRQLTLRYLGEHPVL